MKREQKILLLLVLLAAVLINHYFLGDSAALFLGVIAFCGFALWFILDLVQYSKDKKAAQNELKEKE